MSASPHLSMVGVDFAYNGRAVFNGLTLEIARGEMVAAVGPNGTGKTTLLRLASGFLRPQRGHVFLDGVEVSSLSFEERARRVAVVPQDPQVPDGFTCLEVVLMGRSPHLGLLRWEGRRDLEICRKAMERTQCWDLAARPLAKLSGGERQRVFLARALAQDASLLLLDEPTTHLDIAYQGAMLETVEEVRRATGVTVLAAIHDLSLAAQFFPRMVLLHGGCALADGSPNAVLTAEHLDKAYGAPLALTSHPSSGTPVVLPQRRDGRPKG